MIEEVFCVTRVGSVINSVRPYLLKKVDHFKLQHVALEVNGILKSPRMNIS